MSASQYKTNDAHHWIQSLPIKVIVKLEPKIEIPKEDKNFPLNLSSKGSKPPKINLKEKTLIATL